MMCFYGYHINVDESNLMVVFKASDLTQKQVQAFHINKLQRTYVFPFSIRLQWHLFYTLKFQENKKCIWSENLSLSCNPLLSALHWTEGGSAACSGGMQRSWKGSVWGGGHLLSFNEILWCGPTVCCLYTWATAPAFRLAVCWWRGRLGIFQVTLSSQLLLLPGVGRQ